MNNKDQQHLEELYEQVLGESIRSRLFNLGSRVGHLFGSSSGEAHRDTPAVAEAKKIWQWFQNSMLGELKSFIKDLANMTDKPSGDEANSERIQIAAFEEAIKYLEDPNQFLRNNSSQQSSTSNNNPKNTEKETQEAQTGNEEPPKESSPQKSLGGGSSGADSAESG